MSEEKKKKKLQIKMRDITDKSEGEPIEFVTQDGKRYAPEDLRELKEVLNETDEE